MTRERAARAPVLISMGAAGSWTTWLQGLTQARVQDLQELWAPAALVATGLEPFREETELSRQPQFVAFSGRARPESRGACRSKSAQRKEAETSSDLAALFAESRQVPLHPG